MREICYTEFERLVQDYIPALENYSFVACQELSNGDRSRLATVEIPDSIEEITRHRGMWRANDILTHLVRMRAIKDEEIVVDVWW